MRCSSSSFEQPPAGVDRRNCNRRELVRSRALEHKLVDELSTSDAYLTKACEDADVYEVRWVEHKKPIERILAQFADSARSVLSRLGWSKR